MWMKCKPARSLERINSDSADSKRLKHELSSFFIQADVLQLIQKQMDLTGLGHRDL